MFKEQREGQCGWVRVGKGKNDRKEVREIRGWDQIVWKPEDWTKNIMGDLKEFKTRDNWLLLLTSVVNASTMP